MKHRIRVAALVLKDESVLLVEHQDPHSPSPFWVPPGGGLEEDDESIFACAKREVFEETGLSITASKIAYIREFKDHPASTIHLEVFVIADSFEGEITLENLPEDSPDFSTITAARWLTRSDIRDLVVFPEELKEEFWQHAKDGFPTTVYLGRQEAFAAEKPMAQIRRRCRHSVGDGSGGHVLKILQRTNRIGDPTA